MSETESKRLVEFRDEMRGLIKTASDKIEACFSEEENAAEGIRKISLVDPKGQAKDILTLTIDTTVPIPMLTIQAVLPEPNCLGQDMNTYTLILTPDEWEDINILQVRKFIVHSQTSPDPEIIASLNSSIKNWQVTGSDFLSSSEIENN